MCDNPQREMEAMGQFPDGCADPTAGCAMYFLVSALAGSALVIATELPPLALLFAIPAVFLMTGIIGLPAYLIAVAKRRDSLSVAASTGAAIGAFWGSGSQKLTPILEFGGLGLLCSTVFWLGMAALDDRRVPASLAHYRLSYKTSAWLLAFTVLAAAFIIRLSS